MSSIADVNIPVRSFLSLVFICSRPTRYDLRCCCRLTWFFVPGASQWWRRCTWDVTPVNLKKRAKVVSFGALFNNPSINMVIRCQFSLVLLFVRRYLRRKREKKNEKNRSRSLGSPYVLEKGANTDCIILCLLTRGYKTGDISSGTAWLICLL